MKLKTKLLGAGKTATGLQIPEAIVTALGAGKRPKVLVTINGYTYRSSIASMGGKFMLGVSGDVREQTGVKAGDLLDVALELDTAPREVKVPGDFGVALAAVPRALRFFEGLAYSHKLRHVLAIEGAKAPETRARRIAKAVTDLSAGKK
jgi:hypothetical protein